ncbi:hypothetical protein BDV12DRAFT_203907 [Aspergillus spectabilis]
MRTRLYQEELNDIMNAELMLHATRANTITMASRLLEEGADINCLTGNYPLTPLARAIRWNRPTMLEFLVDRGASTDNVQLEDEGPLVYATRIEFKELGRIILERKL